jgi:hypothetical protein
LAYLERLKIWGYLLPADRCLRAHFFHCQAKTINGATFKIPSYKDHKTVLFGGECVQQFIVDADKLYRAAKVIVEVLRDWV